MGLFNVLDTQQFLKKQNVTFNLINSNLQMFDER